MSRFKKEKKINLPTLPIFGPKGVNKPYIFLGLIVTIPVLSVAPDFWKSVSSFLLVLSAFSFSFLFLKASNALESKTFPGLVL